MTKIGVSNSDTTILYTLAPHRNDICSESKDFTSHTLYLYPLFSPAKHTNQPRVLQKQVLTSGVLIIIIIFIIVNIVIININYHYH